LENTGQKSSGVNGGTDELTFLEKSEYPKGIERWETTAKGGGGEPQDTGGGLPGGGGEKNGGFTKRGGTVPKLGVKKVMRKKTAPDGGKLPPKLLKRGENYGG